MSIVVDWDNHQHTVIRWDYEGDLQWVEVTEAQKQSNALMQSVPYIVHLIIDVTHSPNLPADAFSNVRAINRSNPANTGQVVLVGTTLTIRSVVQTFQKLHPDEAQHISFADTLDKARAWLAASDTPGDRAMSAEH